MAHRSETRKQRYERKRGISRKYPIHIATVNFKIDDNIAQVIRSAVCFGLEGIHVIGSMPERKIVYSRSGSTLEYATIFSYSSVREFLDATRNDYLFIAAELTQDAQNLHEVEFKFSNLNPKKTMIVVGHEELGVPESIVLEAATNGLLVQIPMPGVGFCLNASHAATVMMYEVIKQYEATTKSDGVRESSRKQGMDFP